MNMYKALKAIYNPGELAEDENIYTAMCTGCDCLIEEQIGNGCTVEVCCYGLDWSCLKCPRHYIFCEAVGLVQTMLENLHALLEPYCDCEESSY